MPRVFISYRREDSAYAAQAIYATLEARFGLDSVFMDVYSLPFAQDFRQKLVKSVEHCDVCVVIIGAAWLTASLDNGRRRLDDPRDYVRIELETALQGDSKVLPIVIDNAKMPSEDALPESIRELAFVSALELRPDRAHPQQLEQIVEVIDSYSAELETRPQQEAVTREPDDSFQPFVPEKYSVLADGGEHYVNPAGIKLIIIPAGEFWMGSADSDRIADKDETPRCQVRITSSFLMSICCVTQEQFEIVSGTNFRLQGGTEHHPVVNASWFDAIQYCNQLSQLEGLSPCYAIADSLVSLISMEGYRLPAEAEWEYACRAGSTTQWTFGDDPNLLEKYAWFDQPALSRAGAKMPNDWGLYDMHGSVWEWCWDWFSVQNDTPTTPHVDPQGPDSGEDRVIRGGSFYFKAWNTRSAYRIGERPETKNDNIGFRVVRTLEEQPK